MDCGLKVISTFIVRESVPRRCFPPPYNNCNMVIVKNAHCSVFASFKCDYGLQSCAAYRWAESFFPDLGN
jgi:hypothetical protein